MAVLSLHCCTGFSLVAESRGSSPVAVAQASHCSDFSCCEAWALGYVGFSSCHCWALEHRLNSCDTWA